MRRRFEFRLARVQRVREIEERVARAAWAELEADAQRAEAAENTARRDLTRARDEEAQETGLVGVEISPRRVIAAERILADLLLRVRERKEKALTLRTQADRLAEAWRERERDRRMLEELEKRGRVRHVQELARVENQEQDERAAARRSSPSNQCESGSSVPGPAAD